jgi:hypothetical protein
MSQAKLYGYNSAGMLKPTDLKPTLLYSFEVGCEHFTFFNGDIYDKILNED